MPGSSSGASALAGGMGGGLGPNSYPLQHMGAGGNAIAQAASQAIAATQQLTGRRTSSLKASLEAINLGLQTHDFSIGGELATAAQSALAASSLSGAMEAGVSQTICYIVFLLEMCLLLHITTDF